jgi:cytochrome P450
MLSRWTCFRLFLSDRMALMRAALNHSLQTGQRLVHIRIGHLRTRVVCDPQLAVEVLTKTGKTFQKDRLTRSFRQILGNGLLVSDPETWKNHRRRVQPAFHQARLAEYIPTFSQRTSEWLANWQPGEVQTISSGFIDLTIRVVGECLLGARLGSRISVIENAVTLWLKHFSSPLAFLKPIAPLWPSPFYKRLEKATQELEQLLRDLITEALQTPGSTSFLASLIQQADEKEKPDHSFLRDEILTMLIAGHETTANGLSWMAALLARHPEWQERAALEVAGLGRDPETIADLKGLPVLNAIFQETVRLYPPIWMLPRQALEQVQLGDETLQTGDHVIVCLSTLMRDPRLFNHPDEFRPERWLPDASGQTRIQGPFLAFSAGPRGCIGKDFAQYESIAIFAVLLRRFRLAPIDSRPLRMEPALSLRPKEGVRIRVEARREAPATTKGAELATQP